MSGVSCDELELVVGQVDAITCIIHCIEMIVYQNLLLLEPMLLILGGLYRSRQEGSYTFFFTPRRGRHQIRDNMAHGAFTRCLVVYHSRSAISLPMLIMTPLLARGSWVV